MHESGLSDRHKGDGRARDFWPDFDLKRLAKQLKAGKLRTPMLPRSRLYVWLIRASTSILLWTCVIQLTALGEFWRFNFPKGWPSCHDHRDHFVSEIEHVHVPRRIYKNNGYLMVSCNGGLNQMRAAICDMVAIASYMNVTLIVPELDKKSFWADQSDFNDIFDVRHFIDSLRDELRILSALPEKFNITHNAETIFTMPPVSWSNSSYYINQILPLVKKHKVLHLNRTDARLANNGLPLEIQKLRCRVNYHALRFTPQIEELGQKLVKTLQARGPFIALHLRYEMDMLAFSGCTHGCKRREANQLTRMRYAYPWWKEKIIDSVQKRKDGLCPLTPKETALILKALGFEKNMQIYIAAGEIYGGEKRMAPLRSAFPNIVRKEMLLSPEDLRPFQNHSSQMAALDYMVSLASDVFIPTYDGNMAKVVEGHRRYMGFRKTVLLDRKNLIELLDQYAAGALQWEDFTSSVRHLHHDKVGAPAERKVFPERPKEEDYFYANPQECLSYSSPSEGTRENVPSVHTIESLRILTAH